MLEVGRLILVFLVEFSLWDNGKLPAWLVIIRISSVNIEVIIIESFKIFNMKTLLGIFPSREPASF